MRELKRDAVFLEHAKAEKTEEKEKARQVISRAAAIIDVIEHCTLYLKSPTDEATVTQQLRMNGLRLHATYAKMAHPQHSYLDSSPPSFRYFHLETGSIYEP